MLGIPIATWAAGGGITLLAILYETWRQGGFSALWSRVSAKAPIATPVGSVTDEQAIAAALTLARYKATATANPGYKAVMAAMKATLEAS